MHLSKLIQLVREKWTWNEDRYPRLPKEARQGDLDGDDRSRFQRKHILLHMMRQVGELADVEQDCDHDSRNGWGARRLGRRKQAAKLLINVLQFAAIEGFTESELVADVQRILIENNRPTDLVDDHVE